MFVIISGPGHWQTSISKSNPLQATLFMLLPKKKKIKDDQKGNIKRHANDLEMGHVPRYSHLDKKATSAQWCSTWCQKSKSFFLAVLCHYLRFNQEKWNEAFVIIRSFVYTHEVILKNAYLFKRLNNTNKAPLRKIQMLISLNNKTMFDSMNLVPKSLL